MAEVRARAPRLAAYAAAGGAAALLLWGGAAGLAHRRTAEDVAAGRGVIVAAGWRDAFTFGRWSPPVRHGKTWVRVFPDGRARLSLPLRDGRGYRLELRMDGMDPAPLAVTASVDGARLATFHLSPTPERIGSYTLDVPPSAAGRIDLEAEGGRGFLIWYVRIEPVDSVSAPASPP